MTRDDAINELRDALAAVEATRDQMTTVHDERQRLMPTTLLAELVRRQTATSLLSVMSRTVDRVAEDLAQELLRDPTFRDEIRDLIRAAFVSAAKELQETPPPDDTRGRR